MIRYVKISMVVDTWTGKVHGFETRKLISPRYVRNYILPRLRPIEGLGISPSLLKEIAKG